MHLPSWRAISIASLAAVLFAAAGPRLSSTTAIADNPLQFEQLGRYTTGLADAATEASSGEVVAYEGRRMFVTNATAVRLDIVDLNKNGVPSLNKTVDLSSYLGAGSELTSVAVKNGIVAASLKAPEKTNPGIVVFMTTNGTYLAQVQVGALPDMVTFSTLGLRLLVANEGEPSDDYQTDPEGSVSIISVIPVLASSWLGYIPAGSIKTATFGEFNVGGPRHGELPAGVRIFGPEATVAQDLEPEYISVGPDLRTAYVTLQENNAVAVIDILSGKVERIIALGLKDHNVVGKGLDPSDRDDANLIAPWPVKGMYMPDAIDSYRVGLHTYFVTANEGDARDYDGFAEEIRVGPGGYILDPGAFPNAAALKLPAALGRLNVTKSGGNLDADPAYEEIHVFGARSFSIWRSDGVQVFDSGDQFEQTVNAQLPDFFNASNLSDEVEDGPEGANDPADPDAVRDNRSDNKGPEPEAITIGKIKNRTYAFIGLERQGGVMVYDITNPAAATFVEYLNSRDYTKRAAPDSGPEVIVFIDGHDSPTKKPMLLVANEISGTVQVIGIK